MTRIGSWALAATLTVSACASQPQYPALGGGGDLVVEIDVQNHNWTDVVIYAVGAWSRVRLGSVETGTERRFQVRPGVNTVTGQFYLEAWPVGSDQVLRSEPLTVTPGDRVIWSVEKQPPLSSFGVIPRA